MSPANVAAVVETWVPGANVRRDLLGCIDVVAVHGLEYGVLGIQATTRSNLSSRVAKAKGKAELQVWLRAGNRFECWGWQEVDGRWQPVRVEVMLQDITGPDGPMILPRRRRSPQRELFQSR